MVITKADDRKAVTSFEVTATFQHPPWVLVVKLLQQTEQIPAIAAFKKGLGNLL